MESFVKQKLKKTDYAQIILDSRILFRFGINEILELSYHFDIPFYVVSGGIADIIEASFCAILANGELHGEDALEAFSKLEIFSNEFKYVNGEIYDYFRPIIHILNKQEIIYEGSK